MKKNIIYSILIQVFVLTACSTKVASFKVNADGKTVKYKMSVPKGYKYIPIDYQHARGKIFLYPDSSSLFFTNDTKSGMIYPEKFKKYGSDVGMKFLTNDTLVLKGSDDKERYWEERKLKNIVYGYMKVPPDKKEIFDKLLNSITTK
ncbi:hypothetical protein DC498_25805 [Terrimonas sp.]|uniref:hypothetical protein n=1 Tax=Terrimonas sp. TaxID=1914338 RepID=UPI000D51EBAF|nr:hypothetical protein [Terrimonas sp.]PVD49287.1 hypothetical protein DC498_25805 [Terrimonas sp.]